MADNNQNDEYEFIESDSIDAQAIDDENVADKHIFTEESNFLQKNIFRNILILFGVVIGIFIVYKLFNVFYVYNAKKVTVSTVQPFVQKPISNNIKSHVESSTVTPMIAPEINRKLSALEVTEQANRTDITNFNNQISSINSNMNDLTNKIGALSQSISDLTSKLEQQSQQIIMLTSQHKPKNRTHHVYYRRSTKPSVKYYIQAVIPGRAWLISTNGTTITVREGSSVPGYGIVKLIDPNQGRVLTGSGRIIGFSQQDA